MIKFEKKYLYTFANVGEAINLMGKRGIFSDTYINNIMLEHSDLDKLCSINLYYLEKPFQSNDDGWKFFYYDPHLEVKRAYLKGKTIQRKTPEGIWVDCIFNCSWETDVEYRIKPEAETKTETPMTNREVAEWLAKGNGEILSLSNMRNHILNYSELAEKLLCEHLIRKWSDSEWHKPTKEYIEGVK
jgi:hypothetical protein